MSFTGQGTGIQNANDVFFSGVSRGDSLRFNQLTQKWNNVEPEVIRVSDYGATGNGISDDTFAIQSALDIAYSATNTVAVVTDAGKTYLVSSSLNMGSNTIFGPATGRSTIKLANNSTTEAISITDVENITVRSLDIDMNRTNTTYGGSYTAQEGIAANYTVDCSGLIIDGVRVKNGHTRGINIYAAVGGSISNVQIERCEISNMGESGMVLQCAAQNDRTAVSQSQGIRLYDCTVTSYGNHGILLTGVSWADIGRNIVNGASSTGHGICISGSTTGSPGSYTYHHVTDINLTENKITSCQGANRWGIALSVGTKRFVVSGNIIRACTGGMTIDLEDGTEPGVRIVCDGVVTANSVVTTTTSHGINARLLTGLVISSNIVDGAALHGMAIANAQAVMSVGNVIRNPAGDGIAIQGTNAGTGGHLIDSALIIGQGGTPISSSSPPIACDIRTT